MKIKPSFTHGQKKISFCDAVKEEGIKLYKRTHRQLMCFLSKHENREKIEVLCKPNQVKDNWMNGMANNKTRRMATVDDDALSPLDSPRCVIALLPGDAGYDEMMDRINEENSVCSDE